MNDKYPIFVIHKHKAKHLHYDLRLEKDKVLKSFALLKQPPKKNNIKRLAIEVEDHPLGYEKFEGEIPKGQYGAGKVEIWDKGYYIPIKFTADEIIFKLKGSKLEGVYCLIKFKNKKNNWLFFKKKNI